MNPLSLNTQSGSANANGVDQGVRIAGIGTAVPPHLLPQDVVKVIAERILGPRFPDFARLSNTFITSGVEKRYSVQPLEWFEGAKDWPERTRCYVEGATDLFEAAARQALAQARWTPEDVDTVVTVSSTGIATPTLEARVLSGMGFRRDLRRVPVFGLGCAGGVSGLAIARRLAASDPGSRVLLVCVETCTLAFRDDRLRKADIIATVLFGDGAAALCLGGGEGPGPVIGDGVEHTWPDTLNIMGWDVDPTGFGVIFDRSIPPFVEEKFASATDFCLTRMNVALEDIARFVCHPGGMKVVEAIESTMNLPAGSLDHERTILRDYGNMSAPTVFFVLQRFMETRPQGQMVLAALGPGFTASMVPVFCP